MKPEKSFSWNLVTKNFHAHEQVQQKLRQTLTKLQQHLEHFPSDALHLQVEKKPAELGFLLWLYMLARRELARRCKALQEQARETVALEEPHVLPEDAEVAAGYEPEQPLDIVEQVLEPPSLVTPV